MPCNDIISISIDEQGNKWIGTQSGGLSVFNENGVSVKDKQQTRDNIHVYPNPAHDHVNIEKSNRKKVLSIDILNSQGKLVESIKTNSPNPEINVKELAGGIYFLKIRSENGWKMKKFVKQ